MSDGQFPPFPLSIQILVITINSTSNHFKPLDAAAQTTNDAAAPLNMVFWTGYNPKFTIQFVSHWNH